jgi:hypothetical protein
VRNQGRPIVVMALAMTAAARAGAAEPEQSAWLPAAPVIVDVRSEVGDDLRFAEAILFLDGEVVAQRTAAEDDELDRTLRLWTSADPTRSGRRVDIEGWLPAGEYAMTVELVFRGRDRGPFTYLSEYEYRADASFVFTIQPGSRPVSLRVLASERAGVELPEPDKVVIGVQPGKGSGAVPALDPRGRMRRRRSPD